MLCLSGFELYSRLVPMHQASSFVYYIIIRCKIALERNCDELNEKTCLTGLGGLQDERLEPFEAFQGKFRLTKKKTIEDHKIIYYQGTPRTSVRLRESNRGLSSRSR